ncbi:MAG: hypothetical protein AB7O67_11310 [Vicinamibacterales bacterium]
MTRPKRRLTFWIDNDLALALKAVKDRDGVPEAEQLRRALRAWFDSRGVSPEAIGDQRRAEED